MSETAGVELIEVWSDVVCPWCYIGKRNLEAALSMLAAEEPALVEHVRVVWRSFELDPDAPSDEPIDIAEMLSRKYGTDRAGAVAMMDNVSAVAARSGLHYRMDLAQRANTFDAHRVIHLGEAAGCQDAVKERLLAAHFCEGAALSDHETLIRLAVEAGLDDESVRGMLASDAFSEEVRADERRARSIGISGVPFFLVDGVAGVSGAQPPERLAQMIRQAARKRAETSPDSE